VASVFIYFEVRKTEECLSLAPGFSAVWPAEKEINRFNGFAPRPQAVETARRGCRFPTRLKPGANENQKIVAHFVNQ
jgi:hypothetical protein